jgi:DNA-binding MarR family transcriptional regulator
MATPTIPGDPEFLIQLRRTQHAVRTGLDAELASTGLTTPQYTVLAALEREGDLSASDLAREFGMTAQTVNVLVRALEQCGLLRRKQHPDHGRILLLSLTSAGRRALNHGRQIALRFQQAVLREMPSAERVELMRRLQAVERAAAAEGVRFEPGTAD